MYVDKNRRLWKDEEKSAGAETRPNIKAEVTCLPSLFIYPGNFPSYKKADHEIHCGVGR